MSLTLYQQCVSQFTATTVCDICHNIPGEYFVVHISHSGRYSKFQYVNLHVIVCDVELIKGCPFTPFTEVSLKSFIQNMIVDL